MIKPFRILLLLTLGAFTKTDAQVFTGKGYLLTCSNDTIFGRVTYNRKSNDPETVGFKKEGNEEKENYRPADCKGFANISTGDQYESWVVKKYMSHIDPVSLKAAYSDSIKLDTCFLRLVYKGERISLFHQFDLRDHFFIYDASTNNMEDLVLLHTTMDGQLKSPYVFKSETIITKPIYRNQLLRYMNPAKQGQLKNRIDNCAFDEDSLKDILQRMEGKKRK